MRGTLQVSHSTAAPSSPGVRTAGGRSWTSGGLWGGTVPGAPPKSPWEAKPALLRPPSVPWPGLSWASCPRGRGGGTAFQKAGRGRGRGPPQPFPDSVLLHFTSRWLFGCVEVGGRCRYLLLPVGRGAGDPGPPAATPRASGASCDKEAARAQDCWVGRRKGRPLPHALQGGFLKPAPRWHHDRAFGNASSRGRSAPCAPRPCSASTGLLLAGRGLSGGLPGPSARAGELSRSWPGGQIQGWGDGTDVGGEACWRRQAGAVWGFVHPSWAPGGEGEGREGLRKLPDGAPAGPQPRSPKLRRRALALTVHAQGRRVDLSFPSSPLLPWERTNARPQVQR